MRLERSDYPVIAMIAVFLVLALLLRSSVSDLAQMGTGIRQTGETLRSTSHDTAGQIRSAFGTAADAAGALPVVGSGLADSLRATPWLSSAAALRPATTDRLRAQRRDQRAPHREHRRPPRLPDPDDAAAGDRRAAAARPDATAVGARLLRVS